MDGAREDEVSGETRMARKGSRPVAWWLIGCGAMVFIMVVLGGLTRLTHSGLSMVEWQPLRLLPPLGPEEWEAAFARYRATPEFRLVNSDMDLEGFKGIFWLEFIHRLWGRAIGLAFFVPLVVFAWRGMLAPGLAGKLLAIFALGGLQGLLGWVMVKSGLVDRPDVSHFRLAAHLMTAFLILGAIEWVALDLLIPRRAAQPSRAVSTVLVLTFLTATWGALVAGLDAGLVYGTFPLMNGRLFPDDGADILNAHGAVQFTHRMLAMATLAAATWAWVKGRGATLAALAGLAWVQAALGVATLLLGVPVALASAHQAGAVALFALAVLALRLEVSLRGDRRSSAAVPSSPERRGPP
ncbi:MAG: COX15/CtaA family protein [Alphaproteobacteria bacterium]|nr:COX15/CtaA family protein [Alphaproteobacteria bacterium]